MSDQKQKNKKRLAEWYQKNKERKRKYNREYRNKNIERFRNTERLERQKLRLEVLYRYSKGIPKCACCGETEIRFLSIDHINGRKEEERKLSGAKLYFFLKRNPIDKNIQILCHNCNLAKGFYGECPHKNPSTA